jgi:hypothetical protein
MLFESSEVARFLLEVERSSLDIDEEIDIEDRISEVMRSVGEAAAAILKAREERDDGPGEDAGQPGEHDISHREAIKEATGEQDPGQNDIIAQGEGPPEETGNTPEEEEIRL